ncbi:MAG TPA: substrate-binding domain-containing protein, partial [Solirubrobacteraceae bacterium]|nr:substrate-binding domain-containing protein [Solirubrobacteraceae bacterium]
LLCDVEVDDPRFALLEAAGLPVVVAGHPVSPCPFPAVETDHADGVRLVVEHLLELGHRSIGFAGGPEHYEHVQARLGVWRETLDAAGVEPGPVVHAPRLLDGVTAIVTTSDVLATTLLAEARERGIDVPGALSLTGFDDSPLAALGSPSLTSVRIDYAGFGASAAAQLLAAIAGEPPPPYEPAAPELVIRESTGPAA